jgi:hypothetical protein
MKNRKPYLTVIIIILFLILLCCLLRKTLSEGMGTQGMGTQGMGTQGAGTNFVTLNSWWEKDDPKSLDLYSELFDIPEIKNKYKNVKMYSVFGDPPVNRNADTLYVQFSGESNYSDPSNFDINFIPVKTNTSDSSVLIFPFSAHYALIHGIDMNLFTTPRKFIKKTKFCLFAVSNSSCKERNDFFQSLSTYKTVDSCGKHLNNMGSSCPKSYESNDFCEFISKYKFMICFENKSQDNYFTEKLINAYKCNTIPIYWGCPNIDDYINLDAVFYLRPNFTEDDLKTFINDIIKHDQDEELYLKKYNQPLFKNNDIPECFNKDKVKEKIRSMILN